MHNDLLRTLNHWWNAIGCIWNVRVGNVLWTDRMWPASSSKRWSRFILFNRRFVLFDLYHHLIIVVSINLLTAGATGLTRNTSFEVLGFILLLFAAMRKWLLPLYLFNRHMPAQASIAFIMLDLTIWLGSMTVHLSPLHLFRSFTWLGVPVGSWFIYLHHCVVTALTFEANMEQILSIQSLYMSKVLCSLWIGKCIVMLLLLLPSHCLSIDTY